MPKEPMTPMTRQCAWTGSPFEGKGYILETTEGPEVVSADAYLAPWRAAASQPVDEQPAPEEQADPTKDPEPAE